MLRVKAKQPAYWKAESLDVFDGGRWRAVGDRHARGHRPRAPGRPGRAASASPSASRSTSATCARARSSPPASRRRRRTCRAAPRSPTRRPASTTRAARCTAATPTRSTSTRRARPRRSCAPRAPTTTATSTTTSRSTCSTRSCAPHPGAPVGPVPLEAHFPEWAARGVPPDVIRRSVGGGDPIEHLDGQKELARSNLKRTWALSQRLRSGANGPVDYVNAVEAYLGGADFTYTEAPPPKARTLEGFLFDAKTGYCQQYSGAMALLLRMAGIPARVATGFTSGSLRPQGEGVRRARPRRPLVGRGVVPDLRLGHVRPDAVGRAAALAERRPRRGRCPATCPTSAAAARSTRAPARPPTDGPPWALYIGGGVLAALLLAGGAFAFLHRGRHPGPLLELERALRRTRRDAEPGRDAAGARGGVRPLARRRGLRARAARAALQRPRRRAHGAQRSGLRSELGRGGGLRGRLRAWWALPPRRLRPGS